MARHSPDLWQRLCEKGGGRLPVLCLDKETKREGGLALSYKTRCKIGQGSTSVVYSGVRRVDNRKVALKAMRGTQPEDTLLAQQEYELLRRLKHPCIVAAFDLQHVGGHAVIVLERCEGVDLAQAVPAAPDGVLSEAAACTLTAALARAVEYLHRNAVVHCDVRPQNVLVSEDLRSLKLADFGSALHACGRFYTLPQAGEQVLYVAPEVLLGEPPSPSSDVWQVGLCAYYMLAGKLPQRRDRCEATREALRVVATQHVSLCATFSRDMSRHAKAMLRHCLSIDRLERPTAACLLRKAVWLRPALQGLRTAEGGRACSGFPSALLGGLEPTKSEGSDEGEPEKEKGEVSVSCNVLQSQETGGPPSTASAGTDPSTRGSAFSSHVTAPTSSLPGLVSSEVMILGSAIEKATILLVNYADRTYKVRLADGRIKVVSTEDVRPL